MHKAIVLILMVFFLSTSCSTTGFLGLARESYANEIQEENKKLKEENEQLKEEINTIKKDMEKVLDLADNIENLEELTKEVKSKLDKLPEATLRKIVSILQKYLDEKDGDEE
ncbi:MAG: hypothetical protein JXB88_13655 [Spirochaetales bacterium]|nr:hypothetical protein [Spirochaetales bacterium]